MRRSKSSSSNSPVPQTSPAQPIQVELRHGDAYQLLPSLPDASIDLVATDPPYGSTDCGWDHKIDLREFWAQMWRVLTPAGVAVVFAAQPFATDVINAARKHFRYELVWFKARKVGFLNANLQPLRQHELILVFNRQPKRSKYRPQLTAGSPYHTKGKTPTRVYRKIKNQDRETINLGTRHPTSVLQLNDFGGRRVHPTQKPTDLCRWIVRSYSDPGDLVLDPFAGSASTGVACQAEGRRFIGFERDPEIHAVAAARLGLR